MNTQAKVDFQWTDCWLLQAIIVGDKGDGAGYLDVVAAADGLNHALLTAEEMESGLARLTSAGLVEQQEDRFLASDKARALYAQADTGGTVFDVRDRLESLMGAAPWNTAAPCPNSANTLRYSGYSREKHQAANVAWRREARRALNQTNPRGPWFLAVAGTVVTVVLTAVAYLIEIFPYRWSESRSLASQTDADAVLVAGVFAVLAMLVSLATLAATIHRRWRSNIVGTANLIALAAAVAAAFRVLELSRHYSG